MKTFCLNRTTVALGLAMVIYGMGLGAGTAEAQSFVNGGFETDNWPAGSNAGVSPSGWNTVHSGNGNWPYGVHNDGDTSEEETPFGDQFIELCARDCDSNLPRGSISQTVSGFVVGEQYRLNFQQSPEHHPGETEESIVNVTITGGIPTSTDFSGVGVGGYFTQWKAQSLVFTANATTLTFTFSGVANVFDNTESGIDEVSVSPFVANNQIPTMPIYGLILMMVSLLALAMRRLLVSAKRR